MQVNSNFDGGNIICRACDSSDDIRLEIVPDKGSDFMQWFYFRLSGCKGENCTLTIENAGDAAFTQGWDRYGAVASYNRTKWFRVPTRYENGRLTISHKPDSDLIYYAYFAPYSLERHALLLAEVQESSLAAISTLGETLDGRDIDLVKVGVPAAGKQHCWIIARQHPGETMAEWWVEGFLQRLLDEADPVSRRLLDKAVFYIIPNMNPDGSFRGHLRTNAAGVNINREWNCASLEKSPEVLHVLTAMHELGVDFALDVHGDETLPYVFIAGAEGVPGFSDRHARLQRQYQAALRNASPDFQTEMGYAVDMPGTAHLGKCAKYTANTFDCLAMTLEMPFKDNSQMPDVQFGWSPDRCKKLGAANLDAILAVVQELR